MGMSHPFPPRYLRPYGIVCCGPRAGLVETLADAKSVDHVKQQLVSLDMAADLGAYFDAVYGQGGKLVIQRRFNVGVLEAIPQKNAWHASSSSRGMIARPKMSQIEWKMIEI